MLNEHFLGCCASAPDSKCQGPGMASNKKGPGNIQCQYRRSSMSPKKKQKMSLKIPVGLERDHDPISGVRWEAQEVPSLAASKKLTCLSHGIVSFSNYRELRNCHRKRQHCCDILAQTQSLTSRTGPKKTTLLFVHHKKMSKPPPPPARQQKKRSSETQEVRARAKPLGSVRTRLREGVGGPEQIMSNTLGDSSKRASRGPVFGLGFPSPLRQVPKEPASFHGGEASPRSGRPRHKPVKGLPALKPREINKSKGYQQPGIWAKLDSFEGLKLAQRRFVEDTWILAVQHLLFCLAPGASASKKQTPEPEPLRNSSDARCSPEVCNLQYLDETKECSKAQALR